MATDILTLLQERGITARRASAHKGGEYHGPCPGCGGADRFHVWPAQKEGGTYWCRQCDKAGDLIQFVMDFENLSYPQACERLGREKKAGPSTYAAPRRQPRPADKPVALADHGARPSAQWMEKAAAFVEWSRERLAASPEQLDYLAGRGIPRKVAEAHGLGYNPGDEHGKDLYRPRELWGLPPVEDKKAIWIPRGIVIPHREAGQVVRIRIRRPEGDPRYYIIPGSTMQTLVLGTVKRAAVVIEAELDAIMVDHIAGDLARAVALGAAKIKPDARAAALLSQAALILVALDFDKTGTAGAAWWTETFAQAKRWPVPQAKDPGDAFRAGVDLRAWIKAGFPEGWTIGQDRPDSPAARREAARPDPAVLSLEPTEAVRRLAGLLAAHPDVTIYHTSSRVRLVYPPGWSDANWKVLGEISSLVYFAPGVIDYVLNHPRREITAGNIIANARGGEHA